MKTASFTFGLLVGILVTAFIFAFLKPGAGGSAQTVLKAVHSLPTNHPVHKGIEHFARRVEAYSQGSIRVEIFPNGQLGSEVSSLEQIQEGSLDIAKVSTAALGNFVPVAQLFSLPYVFGDNAHYWSVLDSSIGKQLLKELETNASGKPSGISGLTYFDAGSRNFYTQRPIHNPADLAGLKIRVMNDPVAIDMVKALGAAPTPISWGELYTALQQGVVDGAENNPPSFVSSRHFEVCQEFSFDHHTRIPDVLLISSITLEKLSTEAQGWIQKAADESSQFQREAWNAGVEEALEQMRSQGVTIYEVDQAPFREATQPVRDKYASGQIQFYLDQIVTLNK